MIADWEDLSVFLILGREGDPAAAGRRLGVSRSTVEGQIRALDDMIGAPLLDRSAGRFVPTPAGKELLPVGERTISTAEKRASLSSGQLILKEIASSAGAEPPLVIDLEAANGDRPDAADQLALAAILPATDRTLPWVMAAGRNSTSSLE